MLTGGSTRGGGGVDRTDAPQGSSNPLLASPWDGTRGERGPRALAAWTGPRPPRRPRGGSPSCAGPGVPQDPDRAAREWRRYP